MKQSTYRHIFVLAMALGLGVAGAYAQRRGGLSGKFNKAARGTLSQRFNYRSKSGDRTGATGRSLNLLKPRFETRGSSKGNKPPVLKP